MPAPPTMAQSSPRWRSCSTVRRVSSTAAPIAASRSAGGAPVLGAAVVGLQAAEDGGAGWRRCARPAPPPAGRAPRRSARRRRRSRPARRAGCPPPPPPPRRRRPAPASSTQTATRAMRCQRRQPRELARAHHLVADQDVGNAAPGQRLGLRRPSARIARPRRAPSAGARSPAICASWRGRGASRRSAPAAPPCGRGCARSVEVEQQGGRVDLLLAHAGLGGRRRRVRHGRIPSARPRGA